MAGSGESGEFRVRVPGSKSLTLRHLVAAALAEGESELQGALDCDDSRVLADSLCVLGARIEWRPAGIQVRGTAGRIAAGPLTLDAGESGAALRFLVALSARGRGPYRIRRRGRLSERPVGELLRAIAAPSELDGDGRLQVHGTGPTGGRAVGFATLASSQTVSALLLAAPLEGGPLQVTLPQAPPSASYIELTLTAMSVHGVGVVRRGAALEVAREAAFRPATLVIEGDWSSAAMLLAGAAIIGRSVCLGGLLADSPQGDRRALALLRRMGVDPRFEGDQLRQQGRARFGLDADLDATPDLAPPLAALAATIAAPSRLRGLGRLADKESDRVTALARGLAAVGAVVTASAEELAIAGRPLRGARLDGVSDHRIVMALSLLTLLEPAIVVSGHPAVAKSYPGFFADLARLAE